MENVEQELTEVIDEMDDVVNELAVEMETVMSKKASAARARKMTSTLDKLNKKFRKLSVAYHKK